MAKTGTTESPEGKGSARLEKLRDLADLLEESLDEASVGVRAQLAAQYRATLAEIDSLSEGERKAGDPVDEVAQRRTARRRAASGAG